MDDFWVFGYGSLMWRPGFEFIEQHRAHLYGYRRSLCVHSHVHRGTPEKPGLVLGLDTGGSCSGIAFKVSRNIHDEVMEYLHGRELVTNVYIERVCNLKLHDKRRVPAYCYIVDRQHKQYASGLSAETAAHVVQSAKGQSGHNVDYVRSTVEHLREMKLRDAWLEDVDRRLKP
ncbi:gamma-glutamylcyclotransferase [Lentilitoribacter sp. Alg239-R112]|uniref:gamma-glutamylcyclotransferase n=1 Tax=Lentilitoribacter sp. Alg239-R112 TaxID=2305987 RepID=UPI0013A68A78|nr:gamma-glutamylcyclotransferase [Lentilitoribacter sp. Alg239-R112]